MTATRDQQSTTESAPQVIAHDLNNINCRVQGEKNRPHWLRMPSGSERNHAYALWLLAELSARRVPGSCISQQKRTLIQLGLLQVEKQASESLF
jgi:hypothetical protein